MKFAKNQNLRWRTFLCLIVSAILLVIVDACRKIDYKGEQSKDKYLSESFFTIPADTDPTTKRIAVALKFADAKFHFSGPLSKELGNPLWNKTMGFITPKKSNRGNSGGSADTLVFVPIAKDEDDIVLTGDDNQVKGFMACTVDEDSIRVRLFRGDYYKHYGRTNKWDTLSSETIALTCMLLEARAFPNHDTFDVFDPKLFYNNRLGDSIVEKIAIDTTLTTGGGSNDDKSTLMTPVITGSVCVMVRIFSSPTSSRSATTEILASFCIDTQGWVNIIDDSPNLTVVIPPGGAVNATGGTLNSVPSCTAFPSATCGLPLVGWKRRGLNGIDNPDEYNIFRYDTIGIRNGLRDSFPCYARWIEDTMVNANLIAQIAGGSVFKDSVYMHLTFDTSTTNYLQSHEYAAYTDWSNVNTQGGNTHFHAIIKFNGWYLRNAKREYIYSTIIHECMHAIVKLRFGQYQNWLATGQGGIDSTWMQNHYDIYWPAWISQGIPPNAADDHQIMATDYRNFFTSLVKSSYDPSVNTATRDSVLAALGWGGLYETTAWGLLPSNIQCKYNLINKIGSEGRTGYTSIPCLGMNADTLGLKPPCRN